MGKNLVDALALPATTLTDWCYSRMFEGCSKLNNITMLATDIKNPNMTSLPSGVSGILEDWTVEDYVENSSNLITFSIDGTSYQAEEGMTWVDWVNSEYNTDEYFVEQNNICKINTIGMVGYNIIMNVKYIDIIISNYSYNTDDVHHGGSND